MKAWRTTALAIAVMGATAGTVQASVSLVTSRAAIGVVNYIDWGQLGAGATIVANPSAVTSTGGNSGSVSMPSGSFMRYDQGTGWNGNFAPGDAVLWNYGASSPVTISLSQMVTGIGAQIMANYYGNFTAKIEAFDGSGHSLGSFTEAGNSNGGNNNSAIFIGIASTLTDIKSVQFSMTAAPFGMTGDFALNRVALNDYAPPVPEPATLALLGLAGLGLLARRRHA